MRPCQGESVRYLEKLHNEISYLDDTFGTVARARAGEPVESKASRVPAPIESSNFFNRFCAGPTRSRRQDYGEAGFSFAKASPWARAKGAFTGEISVPMLADACCTHCIVGHSEHIPGEAVRSEA